MSAYQLAPASRRTRVTYLGDEILRQVGGYVAGQFLVAVCAGVSSFIFLEIVGLGKYAVALALVVAILDLIPLIGAIFWKRANTAGAIASMGMGFATALLFMFKDGLDANTPIYYSLGVGLVSFVVVSLLSPRPAVVASAA